MINIQTILASDTFEMMVEKINQGFMQLAELNGGPRGKKGGQGIPGLPGGQGRRGIKGEDGRDGSRIYFCIADPRDVGDTQMININNIPSEDELADLIEQGIYNIGDVFLTMRSHNTEYVNKQTFHKIYFDGENYKYVYYVLDPGGSSGNLWNNLYDGIGTPPVIDGTLQSIIINETKTIETSIGYPELSDKNFDTRKRFFLNTYISSIKNTNDNVTNIFEEMFRRNSSAKTILLWKKNHFKLGIDQKMPFNQYLLNNPTGKDLKILVDRSKGQQVYEMEEYPQQYLNMWDGYAFSNGEDPLNIGRIDFATLDDNINYKIDDFNLLKGTAPILYLHANSTYNDKISGELKDNNDDKYRNFGIFIKRIPSQTIFGGIQRYKSILIFGGGSLSENYQEDQNQNEFYFNGINVWSEGNFVSEINGQNQTNNKRFYTSFISKGIKNNKWHLNNNSTQHIYYGFANYKMSGDYYKKYNYQRHFDIDTGIEIRSTIKDNTNNGSINTWITNSSYVNDNIQVQKMLICRVDENGYIKIKSVLEGDPDDYQSNNIKNSESARFTIYENDLDILKLKGEYLDIHVKNNTSFDAGILSFVNNSNYGITPTNGLDTSIKMYRKWKNDTIQREVFNIKNTKLWNEINSLTGQLRISSSFVDNDRSEGGDIIFTLKIGTTSTELKNIAGIKSNDSYNPNKGFLWVSRINSFKRGASDWIGDPDDNRVVFYVKKDNSLNNGKTIQIKDGNQKNKKILTSDENGCASWEYNLNAGRYLIWNLETFMPGEGSFDVETNTWRIPYDAKMVIINGKMPEHIVVPKIQLWKAPNLGTIDDPEIDGLEVEFLFTNFSRNNSSQDFRINDPFISGNEQDILKLTSLDWEMLSLPGAQLYLKIKYLERLETSGSKYKVIQRILTTQSGSGMTQELVYGNSSNTVFTSGASGGTVPL